MSAATSQQQDDKAKVNERRRMFWMLLILWVGIGWLDLQGLVLGRSSPISALYILVVIPAAIVFGRTGLVTAIVAVVAMYHFTNDKRGITSYTEPELMRLAFILVAGIAVERVSRDRERIRQALEKLQLETRVREDLTHMLVHDLRTPLTGIITSLQTLQMGILGELDKDQQEMIDFAVADGQRLLEMVNQILDVAKLEAREMKLRLEPVDLCELAESALRVVKPLADESGIKLKQSCNGVRLNVDQDLMRRVLVNLLGNAVKFTPKDGEVSVETAPAEDGMAHLVVRDTGYGIPESDLQRIFDKYAQVKGQKKAGPSTGLGLTFCRLAVDAHGGRIWAESELGKGTQMHILLPLRGPEEHQPAPSGSRN
ncbi:MAG: ATP-binding protein [Armatimonadota bacterium]